MPEKKKVSQTEVKLVVSRFRQSPAVVSERNTVIFSEETHHGLHHLLGPLLLPPPLRGRGLLLLQGFLQARHREVLLLCGGHRGLHHRPQQQAELPVVQV